MLHVLSFVILSNCATLGSMCRTPLKIINIDTLFQTCWFHEIPEKLLIHYIYMHAYKWCVIGIVSENLKYHGKWAQYRAKWREDGEKQITKELR